MEQLISYIEEYGAIYTPEAITNYLISQGHAPADIKEAFRIVEMRRQYRETGQPIPQYTRPKPVRRMPLFWWTLVGFVFGVPVLAGLIVALVGGATNTGFNALLIVLLLALVGGIAGSIFYWSKNRALSRGLVWGMGISALLLIIPPWVGWIIIAGVCTFAGGSSYRR